MARRLIVAVCAAFVLLTSHLAAAQEWNDSDWTDGSVPVPSWVASPTVGDGVDRSAEVSTTAQGGDPPALAHEPAAIDESTNYTRSEWLFTPTLPNDREDQGEAKFRLTCNMAFFGSADPIVNYGATSGHHHTFIGNMGVFENGGIEAVRTADFTALRNNPKSSCTGGPLNGTLYWEPTLLYEIQTDVFVPVKPNIVTFYYKIHYESVDQMYRLPRGLAFIGGADPADRLNTVRLAEIPNGQGWLKTKRYNGWAGWACYTSGTVIVPLAIGNDADASNANFARQLVNDDGTDPWGGACEDPSNILIANNNAPQCWDGHNLTSPNGRDHFRYPIYQTSDQVPHHIKCPDGWWQVPTFEVKTEFPNGTLGGDSGHAWRSKLHLSSDRMDADPANWHPPGSTFHFDWMNGWDSVVQAEWHRFCTGIDQNGVAGEPLTCNDSTLSDTNKMLVTSASPDPTMSNDPVITFHSYYNDASKDAFGPIEDGAVLDLTVDHTH